jgi:D-galactarolactone cycloisomerase
MITAIRLYRLSAKLEEPIGNALVFFDRRETLLVELVGADGRSGWGEAWSAPDAAAAIITAQLAPCVLGEDPAATGRLWHAMRRKTGPARNGAQMMAIAALDMAAHDLAARERGVPLASLLGGALRDRIPAYASGPFFKPEGHPYRDFEREVELYLRLGFRAVKLRSGFNPADDAATALAVRRIIGSDRALMVDFNESYAARAALDAATRMAGAGLLWIEEPVAPDNLEGYRLLAQHVTPALAGGETYEGAARFQPFLALGAMDVLQPDIAICGGLTGVGRVVALAEIYDRPVVPHVWGSIVNFACAVQLAATLPEHRAGAPSPFPYLEFDAGPNPLLDLVGRPKVNEDGTVSVPQAPGLGIDLTRERLEPFVVSHREITK